ncbi:hypothetical protein DNHGIG_19890 [Collibacillus ludicampi]|uniref:Addiction module toxin RelE n=1 Tax=Collibacillus ludicampi TaxID=2771369 RepID=A0AAV4LF73_9BACL|nr:hypothetical protein DNHGIG_19890 [Collibacillus ludicampi]
MRKEIFHREFRVTDLPKIAAVMNARQYLEFAQCLKKEIDFIQRDPINNGSSPCVFPPLKDYRKKKFFSVRRPPEGETPDMRLIYRYDASNDTIYYLAVGKRINTKPVNPEDMYQRMKRRDLIFD